MRDVRLGDDIDDFCVRCKRVMNHAVVSVINAAPAKMSAVSLYFPCDRTPVGFWAASATAPARSALSWVCFDPFGLMASSASCVFEILLSINSEFYFFTPNPPRRHV